MATTMNMGSRNSTVNATLDHGTSCQRCGGLLVKERCMDFMESEGNYWFWASRCIQCGDLIDELTLRNRAMSHPPQVIDTGDPLDLIRNALEQAA